MGKASKASQQSKDKRKAKRAAEQHEAPPAKQTAPGENTPLFVAAFGGQLDLVRKLAAEDPSQIDASCQQCRTALHMSAFKGHLEVATVLIEGGADTAVQDEEEFDALMFAAWTGQSEIIQLLIDSKAPVDQTNDEGGTALHLAISGSHPAAAQLLLASNSDLTKKAKGGFTPLHIAAAQGHDDILLAMIIAGGSLTDRTDAGDDVPSLVASRYPFPKDCPKPLAEAIPELWRGRVKAARKRVDAGNSPVQWEMPSLDEVASADKTVRLDYAELIADEQAGQPFIEKVREPAVVVGMTTDWALHSGWKQILHENAEQLFEVKSMSTGKATDIAVADYLKMMENPSILLDGHHRVDPLYMFHRTSKENGKPITDAYSVPQPFRQNLFKEKWQTDKWLIIGTPGSGSRMHTDFYHTSAWNASVEGHKWWCFFPPSVSKETLQVRGSDDETPLSWFSRRLPELLESGPQPIQLLQGAGETVWVPAGWYDTLHRSQPLLCVKCCLVAGIILY